MVKIMIRMIAKERKKFEAYLQQKGKKNSVARQVVFQEAMNAHGHFTAEDLLKQIQRRKFNVSRATVYRSLHDLLEAGVIRETAYGEKHQFYEHLYDETRHYHARCIHCHKVIEFPALGIRKKYKEHLRDKKFKVLGCEVHFYGICQQCQP